MQRTDGLILVSRFIPGGERCANKLITESGRQLWVLTRKGEPLRYGANYLVAAPGVSARARVTGCQTLRLRCRLVCLAGHGPRRGDRYAWRVDEETVLGNERPQWLRSTYLVALSKPDALKALRQQARSFRQPPPAGDCFLVFPGPIERRGHAGPTPVMVRLTPATPKLPTPHKLCPPKL